MFERGKRCDELVEDAGGQRPAGLVIGVCCGMSSRRMAKSSGSPAIGWPGGSGPGPGIPGRIMATWRQVAERCQEDIWPVASRCFEPVEERDDVAAAQHAGIVAVVVAVQPQAGRQFFDAPHVVLQDRGGVVTSPGGQFLGDPLFDGLAEPGLGDAGEVDDPAAAVAEHGGVPDVLALLVFRRGSRPQDRLLQVPRQRPLMAGEPGDVEAGDRRSAGG